MSKRWIQSATVEVNDQTNALLMEAARGFALADGASPKKLSPLTISASTPLTWPADVKHVEDRTADRFHNIARNMNAARELALASGCSHFLFVDSDIILPPDALSSLRSHRKDIIGGWYRMLQAPHWVAGCWVAHNTLFHCAPTPSVSRSDMVGHGCMLLSRRALEALSFEAGFDKTCRSEVGDCYLGPCAAFGNLAASKGFNLYMDGHVICGHIDRKSGMVVGQEQEEEWAYAAHD